jgi:hypothetical protein
MFEQRLFVGSVTKLRDLAEDLLASQSNTLRKDSHVFDYVNLKVEKHHPYFFEIIEAIMQDYPGKLIAPRIARYKPGYFVVPHVDVYKNHWAVSVRLSLGSSNLKVLGLNTHERAGIYTVIDTQIEHEVSVIPDGEERIVLLFWIDRG